ncbi:MAG: hypothetical protein II574_06025, partial [Ruminococcus sp.]|nr:hypothetical protein [Ruminococcus sp.]
NDKIDTMCQKISEVDVSNYGTRRAEIEMLLSDPKTEIQMDMLVSEIADREEYSRKRAYMIIKEQKQKLQPKHYKMLEDMLRYKAADVRESIIELLLGMGDDELFECAKRLVSDKKEEKRTAGLDIIMQIGKDEKRAELYKRCLPLAKLIEKPTSKEQILIDQLTEGGAEKQEKVYGYGFYSESDSYEPKLDQSFISECDKIFAKFFPASVIGGKKKAAKGEADFEQPLKALDKLIEENKNYEFTNKWGEKVLFGTCHYFEEKTPDGKTKTLLAEVWDKFYDEQIKDPVLLERMIMGVGFESDFDEIYDFFGHEYKSKISFAHGGHLTIVLEHLAEKHLDMTETAKASFALLHYIYTLKKNGHRTYIESKEESYWTQHYVKDGKMTESKNKVYDLFDERCIKKLTRHFDLLYKDNFAQAFALDHLIADITGHFTVVSFVRENNGVRPAGLTDYSPASAEQYVRASFTGIISEGYMYKYLFELTESFGNVLSILSSITKSYHDIERKRMTRSYYGSWRSARALGDLLGEKEPQINDDNRPLVEYAVNVYEKLLDLVLDSELKRGDTAAEFTDSIMQVGRIYGAQRLVQILAALGKDTLERSSGYSTYNISKRRSLSHLLGVCVPSESDNAKKLGELLAKTDITEKRLVEAALYSPEWIDIIGEHLGWEGFRSACFYFMAHMNEHFDDVRKAMIAKFTPIPTEELSDGSFDIDWFKESLAVIGEKHFDMIYDAAKYISDGSKHSRARKYADAIIGRYDKDEALKQIKDKRNKDSLMAYALLPVNGEDDIFSRYMLFKQFKKESTKFGAQRRASESAASDMAMRNLALNAGFSDVTRLTLRMETKLFDDIKPLTEPNTMGDVTVRLNVDEDGKAEIICEKGGQALKSV